MSSLINKAKDAISGHHDASSSLTADDDAPLPGNIVNAPGGTYDAGPGVKDTKSNDPPKTVSDPHDTSKGVSSDAVPPTHGAGSVVDEGKGNAASEVKIGSSAGSDVKASNDPKTGTDASSVNKKDNYDPEDVERDDGGKGLAKGPLTSEGPEKVFDQ